MLDRLRPDRLPNREPSWFVADAFVALLIGFLTVEGMRSTESVREYGAVTGRAWLWLLGPTALVLVRRWAPASALAAATACYLVSGLENGDGNAILAAPLLAYTVALTRPPRISAAMVGAAAFLSSTVAFYGPGGVAAAAFAVSMASFGIGWIVGVQVRRHLERSERLAADADLAREEAAEVARQAVADERARIARELHDAVGHAVNVMVVQAGAVRMAGPDERTTVAMREIERVGRSALADLDQMLGLLRADDQAPREPTHGVHDIPGLVDGVRAAGADVVLLGDGADGLDTTTDGPVGAAAYRIVQEALTNAVKHAGPAHIEVTLHCARDEVVVTVEDDGRGAAAPTTTRSGRGLVGMRERVAVLGGQLEAGPRAGGGYRVEARLPRRTEAR